MKTIITIFLILSFNQLLSAGINPTFNLTVKNIISNPGPNGQDSIITFEMWMQQTNQGLPGVFDFEYCCGQYTFQYNKAIHSPGGNLILNLLSGGSELPPSIRPPSFSVDSVNGFLKASGNLPQPLANFFISGTFPGTKILTFRLRTNQKKFNMAPLNLKFKLGSTPNTFVAYFLPYPDSVDSNQHPSQFAVALMDTIENHYSVDSSFGNYHIIRLKLTTLIEGKYNNVFNLLTKKDSIKVYLRNAYAPFEIKDSAAGVLDSINFSSEFTFYNGYSGGYYIVVKHYQGIETWSKAGGDSITENSTIYNYDFTTSSSQAYLNNLVLKGSKYCIYSGDIDQNGFINLTDVLAIYNDVVSFQSGEKVSDLNGDKILDLNDILIALNNCNTFIRIRRP